MCDSPGVRPRPRPATAAACLVLVALGTLVGPAPAAAHTVLRGTAPAAGATVPAPVAAVALVFDEPVRRRGSTVAVTGPDGLRADRGDVRVMDATATQPVDISAPGSYTVGWDVVSPDGHRVRGRFAFTVAGAAPSASRPAPDPTRSAPTAPTSDGPPSAAPQIDLSTSSLVGARGSGRRPLPWLLGGAAGVLLVGLVTAVLLRRGRRGPRPE